MMIGLLRIFLIIFMVHIPHTFSFVTSNILNTDITSCTMDQTAMIFYAAVEEVVGQPGIVKALNIKGSESPQLSALNSNTVGKGFKYITMVCDQTTTIPSTVAAVTHSDNGLFNRLVVTNASCYTMSGIIEDPDYDDDTYGLSSQYASYVYPSSVNDSEILAIAAAPSTIFSLVHRVHNDFLAPGSAINVHKITVTSNAITIDPTYTQKRLDSRDFLVGESINKVGNVSDEVSLCYNKDLKTLYCAPNWITSANSASHGVRSVAAYKFNSSDFSLTSLPLHQTANESFTTSWGNGNDVSTQNIIGVIGSQKTLSVHNLAVMTTSTNKYYLIVYGGHGFSYQCGNQVYALPLVGPSFSQAGMLANVEDTTFSVAASNASQLYTASSKAAKVGDGPVLWEASNYLNHMVVINDTVYISVHNPGATRSGIYYSQAKFNDKGIITTWTPWTLAAPRTLGASEENGTPQGAVKTFCVSKITGKIWAVPSDNLDRVRVPSWVQMTRRKRADIIHRMITRAPIDERSPDEALYDTLRTISTTATWSVENDQGERVSFNAYVGKGWLGRQQIVIIRTGIDDLVKNTSNFKVIDSPTTESILSIGFLQSPIDTDYPTGIFLLGTQTKLYAYIHSDTCCGGYVNNVDELNVQADTDDLGQGYWATAKWYHILPSIFNANIASIDALYGDLYILQRAKDFDKNDTLYRISREDIAAHTLCNATPKIICQANITSSTLPYMLNHIVLPSEDDATTEHIVVGSYSGAFTLTVPGGIQTATTPHQVTITPIPETQNQKIVMLERTSDNESRIVSQNTQNKLEDKTIYVAPAMNGQVTTSVITTQTIPPISSATHTITTAAGTPAIVSNRPVIWTDGARKFTLTSNTLISQEGISAEHKISEQEKEVFSGKQLYSIEMVGGVLTVKTQDKALYLK